MIKKIIQYLLEWFYPLVKKALPFDVYAYLAVGAANTALNIVLFAVSYQFLLSKEGFMVFGFQIASYTVSLLIAFLATVPTGFWLAKNFAFREGNSEPASRQLGKYFLVVLQGLGTDYLLLIGFIVWVGVHPTSAKLLSTVLVLTLNFLLQKYFTFRVRKEEALTQ